MLTYPVVRNGYRPMLDLKHHFLTGAVMRWVVIGFAVSSFAACAGSELEQAIADDTSVDPDTEIDTSVDPDTDTNEPPLESTIEYWFVTDAGDKCKGVATCSLVPSDEPAAYEGTPGFQIDIDTEMTGVNAGANVELRVDGSVVAQGVATDGGGGLTTVRFTSVTMPVSSAPLVVTTTVTDANGDPISHTKDIDTNFEACGVVINAPTANGCGSLSVQNGEIGIEVTVAVTGDCDEVSIESVFNGTNVDDVSVDDDGDAVAFIVLGDENDAVDGEVELTVTAIHPSVSSLNGAGTATITVDNVAPTVGISDPTDGQTLGAADDTNNDPTDGIQFDVLGTSDLSSDDANSISLFRDGDSLGTSTPAANGEFAFGGVTFTDDGEATLLARATDSCGNIAEETITVTIAATPATFLLVAPTGGVLLAKDDADDTTSTTYETDFTVGAPDAADGAVITVQCSPDQDPPAWVAVGSTTVDATNPPANGEYVIGTAIDTTTLGSDVICRAIIDLPTMSSTGSVNLTLAIPAPTLTLSAPATGVCLTTKNITVTGIATGLDGQPIEVTFTDDNDVVVSQATTGSVVSGVFSIPSDLAAAGVADGAYTVTVDATDANGNIVSDTQATPESAITIDTVLPVLTLLAPAATIDPDTDPAQADSNGAMAGYQTAVQVDLADANAIGGELCLEVNGAAVSCNAIAGTPGIIAWADVTLQPGANTLTAIGEDSCGNSSSMSWTITLVASDLAVAITDPATDITTASPTRDITVTVNGSDGTTPVVGATVTLTVNGAPSSAVPTDNNDGTYTFAAVPLTAGGTTTVTANATNGTQSGASGPRVITNKNVTPTITIDAPADNSVFNAAAVECLGTAADCVTDVEVSVTNVENGSTVELTVTCGANAPVVTSQVFSGAALTFAGVTLVDGETCTATADVTDAVGQMASDTATYTVDRTAPTIEITSPATTTLLAADDADPAAGIQHALTAAVGGVEAGQTVTAQLSWTDALGMMQSATFTYDTATAGSDTAVFEDAAGTGWVTFADGVITITTTVSDVAGNSASDTAVITVSSSVTEICLAFPAFAGGACTIDSDCANGICVTGSCWNNWNVANARSLTTNTTGLTGTADLRVCTNDPGAAANPACDTAGFTQVLATTTTGGVDLHALGTLLNDGLQTLIAEVQPVAGGPWLTTAACSLPTGTQRNIAVDVNAPQVTLLGSPNDADGDDKLNISEQAALPRVFDIEFTSDQAGTAVINVNGAVATTTAAVVGVNTVQLTLAEGLNTIFVVISDGSGNASPATPSAGALSYAVTVDTIAPTLGFSAPTSTPLNAMSSLDIIVLSDAEGEMVNLLDGGVSVAMAPVVSGQAVFDDATFGVLTEGTHTLTASVDDGCGNTTSAATTPASIFVDTVAPSCIINSPMAGAVFGDADDASTAAGFQIPVSFDTTMGAVMWTLSIAKGCDAAHANCAAPVVKASGSATNPDGTEPVENITVDIDAPITFQQLVLETVDAVGNVHTTTIDLTFNISACSLTFTDLPASGWYNVADCAGGTPCASTMVTVTVQQVGVCNVDSLELSVDGMVVGTDAAPGGTSTFTVTLNDGDTPSFEAVASNMGTSVASTGVQGRQVDLMPPTVEFVTQTVSGFATPAEGSTQSYCAVDDISIAMAGLQIHTSVTVTDTNAAGGAITTLTSSQSGALTTSSATLPTTLAGASPINTSLLDVTLVDGASQTITVMATDAAGNVGTSTFVATVDNTPPAPVEITNVTVQQRRPRLIVSVVAPGDDGMTNGPATSYIFKYSRNPITEANFAAACDMVVAQPTPSAPGSTDAFLPGGPDPRPVSDACKWLREVDDGRANAPHWYLAVKAVDAKGNESALTTDSTHTVMYDDYRMDQFRVKFDNTNNVFGASGIGFMTLGGANIGDVNDDGIDDIGVGFYFAAGGPLCVVYGHTLVEDLTIDTLNDPGRHTCVPNGTAALASTLGITPTDFGNIIQPLGDVNGDGIDDFGTVGTQPDGAGREGFAVIYLGSATGVDLENPEVVVRGLNADTPAAGPYLGLCGGGDFDGLAVGGVFADDIVVGDNGNNSAIVIPGDPSWVSGSSQIFDASQPGGGPSALATELTITLAGSTVANRAFGRQCAMAGDILDSPVGAPGKADLLLSDTLNGTGVVVIPGREFTPGSTVTIGDNFGAMPAGSEDSVSVRLVREAHLGTSTNTFGKGYFGHRDLTNDGIPDVVVTDSGNSLIHIFDGAAIRAAVGVGPFMTINGSPTGLTLNNLSYTGARGFILDAEHPAEAKAVAAIGDLDFWTLGAPPLPTVDLAYGVPAGFTTGIEIRNNHRRGGGVAALGEYPVLDGFIDNRFASPTSPIGFWVDGGDFDGDGLVDIISGSSDGEILIIH